MNKIRFDGIYRKRNDEEWGNDYLIFKSDGSVVDTSSLDDPVNTFFLRWILNSLFQKVFTKLIVKMFHFKQLINLMKLRRITKILSR